MQAVTEVRREGVAVFPQTQNICPPLASSLFWEAPVLAALCSSQKGVVDNNVPFETVPVYHFRCTRYCQCVLFWPPGSTPALSRSQELTRPWIEPSMVSGASFPHPMALAPFYVLYLD